MKTYYLQQMWARYFICASLSTLFFPSLVLKRSRSPPSFTTTPPSPGVGNDRIVRNGAMTVPIKLAPTKEGKVIFMIITLERRRGEIVPDFAKKSFPP